MKTKIFGIAWSLIVQLTMVANAQDAGKIPSFLGPNSVSGGAITEPRTGIHFLTTLDFPPFSFLDAKGRLNGFDVYLAKQLCAELAVMKNCTIQGLPWDELEPALARGQGDAVIAGVAATEFSRERYAFSKPYLRPPARFVGIKTKDMTLALDKGLPGVKIGVLADSSFESNSRSYFKDAIITGYASDELLIADLNSGHIDLIYGDGMRLGFFLSTEVGSACCSFAGGPYFAFEFLGEGMRIAFSSDNEKLRSDIDHALTSLQRNGKIQELYLRFFPNGIY